MADDFAVRVSCGSLRADDSAGFVVPHAWTDGGVVVEGGGTGAHLLHAAVALCVLNDLAREAAGSGLTLHGILVDAKGRFDDDWASTGVSYRVGIESDEDDNVVSQLVARVDETAEIPRALRAGTTVRRTIEAWRG